MSDPALSHEQRLAAESPAQHVMLIAPPGCGKTEVLAHRAAFLIPALAPNQRLLALTFTNRAQANLKGRLRSVLGYARARRFVTVRNFHGHASEIVLAHGRTIGLDPETLRLPKTTTLRKALEATGRGRDRQYAAEAMLRKVKREPLSDDEVLDFLTKQPVGEVRDTAVEVERARQSGSQLHYEDLLRHAQRLLRIPTVGNLYRCHFGAVLVDEFQDLSLQQLDIAQLSCAARRTYAGDRTQGIFSWAGAAPDAVERHVQQMCGVPISLRESYRSSPKVLVAVNAVGKALGSAAGLVSACPDQWKDGGCSARLSFNNRGDEARWIAHITVAILTNDPNASVGVISRAAWRREDVDHAFATETRFVVRRWDLALDDPRVLALIRQSVATLPRDTRLDSAHEAVLNVVEPFDVETREQVDDAFEALEKTGASTVRTALRSIRLTDPSQAVEPGVHLLNAHTGKGQQFDWVFVIGLEEGHLPGTRSNQGTALAEEQRVLLVMLSRARHGLVVSRVEMNVNWRGPYKATKSRWWSEIDCDLTTSEQVESHIASDSAVRSRK